MYINESTPYSQTGKKSVVLLPIGSYEQHGPYLPVDTDTRIAQLIAEKLMHMFSLDEVLLLPSLPFSCSWEHQGLATISLGTSTVSLLLHDIAASLQAWGRPTVFLLINWHGGNSLLSSIATEITARKALPTTVINCIHKATIIWNEKYETLTDDAHAGAIETSVIQAYWPQLIREKMTQEDTCLPTIQPAELQSVLQMFNIHTITQKGIWGAPYQAAPDRGETIIEELVSRTYEQVKKLLELVNTHYK